MSKPAFSVAVIVCALSILPTTFGWASDEPIWDGNVLIYPEGAQIPAGLTDVERAYLEKHPLLPGYGSEPPTGPVYCVPEYDPMEGVLIAWEGFTDILREIAYHVTTTGDGDVYVVVDNGSEQASAQSALQTRGVDLSRVRFVVCRTDTVWIRDYGPRYVYEGNCRAIVDHTYNRPRPNDNAFNAYFSSYKNHAIYDLPLVHGGGNYHLNGLGEGNATRLVNDENPSRSEQEIHDVWLAYQNVDTTFWTPFPQGVDSTQHIDMWMQIVGDAVIVISDWPHDSGSTQDELCDNAAADFISRGWTVYRTPARRTVSAHYTYTNVVLCNDVLLIPYYTNPAVSPHNAEALASWQAACPDKTIVQINCEGIIGFAGALHCIVMHVPAPLGGQNPTVYLKNLRGGEVLEPETEVTIRWISDDDVAVASVDILLSTDGGQTFPIEIVAGTEDDGAYTWMVPDIDTTEGRIRLVVHDDDGHRGSDESDSNITILGCPADLNGDGVIDLQDLAQLLASYDKCAGDPGYDPEADLDGDNCVTLADLAVLLAVYGTTCP